MRDFFLELLYDLDKLCGLNQYLNLCALPEKQSKEEINKLLDMLCETADKFKTIPDDHKKRFIREGVMTDTDFRGFNVKIIYKWLIAKSHMYLKEEETEVPKDYKPLTGEERLKMLKEWEKAVMNIGTPQPAENLGSRLRSVLSDNKGGDDKYIPPSDNYVIRSELHIQYCRENYDPITGKQKPEWISESDWLKQKGY